MNQNESEEMMIISVELHNNNRTWRGDADTEEYEYIPINEVIEMLSNASIIKAYCTICKIISFFFKNMKSLNTSIL